MTPEIKRLRAETDQLMHRPLHMDHEARLAALATERNAADFEIERLTRELDEALAEVEELRTRTAAQLEIETRARDEARADAARLRGALEPFARFGAAVLLVDGGSGKWHSIRVEGHEHTISLEDFRRARAALEKAGVRDDKHERVEE